MTPTRKVTVITAYPLLGTAHGDEGNARVLRHRAALRGVEVAAETVYSGPLPTADIYLIGGEGGADLPDLAQALAALPDAVADGAVVLGVNAGYQVLGEVYPTPGGASHPGLGLLPVRTSAGRYVEGPVVTLPNRALGLPAMSGYECHATRTELDDGALPLTALRLGVGNGGRPPSDGALRGRVVGTYLHGPVLARNPELADLLLGWALGTPLEAAQPGYADAARAQRIAEDLADQTGWAGARH